jgi:membrane-bound serine protease (ClpP class)
MLFSFLALTLFLVSQSVMAERAAAASGYYVASLNAGIDAGAQDFVTSSLSDAKSSGDSVFILVLNTFGGNGNNMDNIIQAISNYETAGNTFITLVAPAQTHAFSAGAFIAEASTKIYMVNQTVIGSATPVLPPLSDPTELRKDISGFSEYMKAITDGWNRNGTAAAQMVTNGTSYTNTEATNLHVINGTLPGSSLSVRDALAALPAPYTVQDAQNIQIHEPGIRATAIAVLSDPNLDSVLFLLGVFAILIDLFHPTLILSAIGATALALALVGLGVFGASLVSIVLMLVGALFIFLEIKIHHGLSALIGVAIFIIGFILIFRLPPAPPVSNQPTGTFVPIGAITYVILGIVGGGVVLGSLYLYKVREALMHRPPTINPKAIIGKQGQMKTDLKAGEVATAIIGAEEWTVTSTQDISQGTRVLVKDMQGLKLVVEKMEA